MAYQPIPAEMFDEALVKKGGFKKTSTSHEVVYEYEHQKHPGLKVRVFSSVSTRGDQARACGQDAIRVTLAYYRNGKSWGLGKATRVNRTGAPEEVLKRTIERAREMYALGNQYVARGTCRRCGSLTWARGACIAETTLGDE